MAKTVSILFLLLVVGVLVFQLSLNNDQATIPTPTDTSVSDAQKVEQVDESVDNSLSYDFESPDSLQVLVNRTNKLPSDHVPKLKQPNVNRNSSKSSDELSVDQRIAKSVEELFAAARKADLSPMLASAYRSYELQSFYYNNYVQAYGQAEADKFSAQPGTSEHQTGLAIDIARIDSFCYLEQCFSETELGVWLADNAYKYGFILRYPEGKSDITGYQFEPWHFRYVGDEVAEMIFKEKLTYEEFVQNSAGE